MAQVTPRPDNTIAKAVEQARAAATVAAADFGVGEHLWCTSDGERMATHYFTCTHPAYPGWAWAVTMTRVPRAKSATVDEVVLLPASETALLAPAWVPWSERLQPGDIAPGMLLPTLDNDPRLEPGFTGGEMLPDDDPAEWSLTRALVAELGLGRERLLSPAGRTQTAVRWISGSGGPNGPDTRFAPANCISCGFFIRLSGRLGNIFGVCTNEYSPFDARVVSFDHGCGGHSDVVAEEREIDIPVPVYDTIGIDQSIFD
ncbi:MAG: DUF3027 domain-containing protein [Propionibacteriaceae bacterium]|jgi:hypothetical protein|nr:DUF3027 domain-containing protein [Propionibacteriaceae bacterium]